MRKMPEKTDTMLSKQECPQEIFAAINSMEILRRLTHEIEGIKKSLSILDLDPLNKADMDIEGDLVTSLGILTRQRDLILDTMRRNSTNTPSSQNTPIVFEHTPPLWRILIPTTHLHIVITP